MTIGDEYTHPLLCTCGKPWNGVIPPPPCPVHYQSWVPYYFPQNRTPQFIQSTFVNERLGEAYGVMTEEFFATLGLTPGYSGKGTKRRGKRKEIVRRFVEDWEYACDQMGFAPIPAVISISKVVYPGGDEDVVTITGTRNPVFVDDPEAWRKSVTEVVNYLRVALGQTTTQLSFRPVRLTYLRDGD